jgi:Leucine-rich repeat (LRR) protein
MIWASGTISVSAREIEANYPPCIFNVLCTCSKAAPDLGIVHCKDVPFPSVPRAINTSKVFMLKMENTGLRELEGHFLQATGLYNLEINDNPISDIPEDAFGGLERSLWKLSLRHNRLIEVPSKALRYLQKLVHLDLTGNEISHIDMDSFRGLRNSLETLVLADNSISELSQDDFQGLPNLDTIDLSGNSLTVIDPRIFQDGMGKLSRIILADNLLKEIPYEAFAPLRSLRVLDLSSNRINSFLPEETEVYPNTKLSLDALHLEYNQIEMIVPASFQYFSTINQTFLDFNPIHMISVST